MMKHEAVNVKQINREEQIQRLSAYMKRLQPQKEDRQYGQYGCCVHEDVPEESLEEPAAEVPERM